MRGLDIRAAFAIAKIKTLINADAENEAILIAMFDAEREGFGDFERDISELPLLFVGEPTLVQAWNRGYDFAAECSEMAECSNCQDGIGDPCRTHG